ncbi:MAG: hypothetical protein K1Y02_20255 [Candidatus Hydrogenedentes bacterium]|nr:hypothetical protein [Candidatus Hydrogenedentota bacterium]
MIAFLASAACALALEPVDVGNRAQLFIDRRFIANGEGIELRMNQAQKLGRIRDESGNYIRAHVSRVYDIDGKTRLYTGSDGLDVYESEDGLQFKHVGSIGSQGRVLATVFLDPHESDTSRRYKLFNIQLSNPSNKDTDGVYASYSADGLTFSEGVRIYPRYTDNPAVVWWDARIGKYVIYTRALAIGSENQRRIARIETDDPLKPWPYTDVPLPHPFNAPENAPVVLQADEHDDPFSDMYYSAATLYPYAQDVYLMFTANFRHFAPNRQPFVRPRVEGQWEDFGLLETQIAVSRDGIEWLRPSREPYYPTGLADEWDRWYAVMAPGVSRHGNYLYQYYVSSGMTHDSTVVRQEYAGVKDLGGIGAVRQRVDGFFSADAGPDGGWLETPPIVFAGSSLRLNIDTGAMGTAFVELRDADGKPIPGFELAQCEEIGGNYLDQAVYWNGSTDVSKLAGSPVRLYIRLVRGKLYSFRFSE